MYILMDSRQIHIFWTVATLAKTDIVSLYWLKKFFLQYKRLTSMFETMRLNWNIVYGEWWNLKLCLDRFFTFVTKA